MIASAPGRREAMRAFRPLVLAGVMIGGALPRAQEPAPAGAAAAAKVLAATREALGGESRLTGVKNFIATGRTRQGRGDNLVPIEVEIACALPDKDVRTEQTRAQESGPTATGFNGEELIQVPAPPPPPPGRE